MNAELLPIAQFAIEIKGDGTREMIARALLKVVDNLIKADDSYLSDNKIVWEDNTLCAKIKEI